MIARPAPHYFGDVTVVFSGGYDCDFSGKTGRKSVLDGSLTIKKRVVEIDGLLIK